MFIFKIYLMINIPFKQNKVTWPHHYCNYSFSRPVSVATTNMSTVTMCPTPYNIVQYI